MQGLFDFLKPYTAWLLFLGAGLAVGMLAYAVVRLLGSRLSKRTETNLDDALVKHCTGPLRLLLPVAGLFTAVSVAPDPPSQRLVEFLQGVFSPVAIGLLAWLLIRVLLAAEEFILSRYSMEAKDNLQARKVHTQIRVIRKLVVAVIIIVAAGAALMNYESFRQVGTGILASAGIAGIIVGFAAQRTLANLLAGFQIAVSQPIRVDDVVVVEGEWGRIEEITLTYVVVKIWDLRRLILPISYFIEKPFQNWTRVSSEILGVVTLQVDYTVPVSDIREAFTRILKDSEHWDGNVNRIHVTDSGEKTMTVRALMSGEDSGKAWELRCEVREKLIGYLQEKHPGSLPRLRLDSEAQPESS